MLEIESLDFMTFKVRLANGKVKEFDLNEELAVSEETLEDDFMNQAGKYAWWATLAEIAKNKKERMEAELDEAEAEADRRVRDILELDGVKITEALVKSRIKLDEDYKTAVNNVLEAKKYASILDKVVKALEHRKEMLISVGAHLRSGVDNASEVRSLKEKASTIVNR